MSTSCANNYLVKDTEIELTNLCNAKCPLCYRNNKDYIAKAPYQRPLNEVINQLDLFTNLESIKLVGKSNIFLLKLTILSYSKTN